jgi:hypothetical protein
MAASAVGLHYLWYVVGATRRVICAYWLAIDSHPQLDASSTQKSNASGLKHTIQQGGHLVHFRCQFSVMGDDDQRCA